MGTEMDFMFHLLEHDEMPGLDRVAPVQNQATQERMQMTAWARDFSLRPGRGLLG